MRKFTSIAAAMLLSVATFAQAPQGFSYQAVVRDAQNNIVANQSVVVDITILQGASLVEALPVYSEKHTAKTNQNGLLTLTIGKGESAGSIRTVNWGKGNCYLRTKTEYGEATSQLMSVPYALYADNAGSINYTELVQNLSKVDLSALNLVNQTELANYAKVTDLPVEQNLSNYVQKTELSNYATTTSLAQYATAVSLDGYATNSHLDDTLEYYALKSQLPEGTNLSAYATIAMLNNKVAELEAKIAALTADNFEEGQKVSTVPVDTLVFITNKNHITRKSKVSEKNIFEMSVFGQAITKESQKLPVPTYEPQYLIIKVLKNESAGGKDYTYSITSVVFNLDNRDNKLTLSPIRTATQGDYNVYIYQFGPVFGIDGESVNITTYVNEANEVVN